MGKISIQELATALAEQSSLTKKESSAFVSAMFDIIQEALERDRNVKIKGLGTFKIIDVEDRESINVNTGERVLIEGHGKITFTPDPLMKELVNKPFSQFETVVLNDGVEFGEAPEESVGITAILPDIEADPKVEIESETLPKPEPALAPDPEPVSVSEPEVEPAPAPEPEPIPVKESEHESEPEVEPSAMPLVHFDQSDDEAAESDEDIPEWVIEPIPAPETPVEDAPIEDVPAEEESVKETPVAEEEPVEDDPTEEEEFEEETSNSKKWIWFALLALLLGLAGGYVLGNYFPFSTFYSPQTANTPEVKVAPAPVVKESPKVEQSEAEQPEPEVEQKEDQASTTPEAKQEKEEIKPAEPETPKTSKAAEAPKEDIHAKYAAKDARVRTGAYRIVGTKKVVKAKEGETLARISNRNLGPGMECYVEVYNDMKASTSLKEGQEIKIPELVLKKKKKAE